MKALLRSAFLFILALCTTGAFAQQDPQFTHFMFNYTYFNPAYAGMPGVGVANLLSRSQWTGWSGVDGGVAPRTAVMSFNAPFQKYQSGVSALIMADQIGINTHLNAMINYSYHLQVGEGKLGIGLGAGVNGASRDNDKLNPQQEGDPSIAVGSVSEYKPDADFGVWYQTQDYFAGISSKHIFETRYDFNTTGQNYISQLARHYYLTGGYHIRRFHDLVITPMILYRNANGAQGTVDAAVMFEYDYNRRDLFGTIQYRYQENIAFIAGLGLTKDNNLRLSYAFDLVTSNVEAKAGTSHELLLSYRVPIVFKPAKPVIRTPRYRK